MYCTQWDVTKILLTAKGLLPLDSLNNRSRFYDSDFVLLKSYMRENIYIYIKVVRPADLGQT